MQPASWLALQAHLLHFDHRSTQERQPYSFGQESTLTWDGRLDNREDLQMTLHHQLGSDPTDAAIVAAAYERWGIDAIPRLVGDWCLAIWDAPQQQVILARDYIGNRPLYYRVERDRLAWATRLEALATCEGLLRAPNDAFIASHLTTGAPAGMSPFSGISSLVAGHVLVGRRDSTSLRRYWQYSPASLRYRSVDQYGEHLRTLLTDAVRFRLRTNGTAWSHLSGGWDSSSVVCLATRLIAQRRVECPSLRTISMIYADREAEGERRFIAAVEQWCGLETMPWMHRGPLTFAEMLGHRILRPTHDGYCMNEAVDNAGGQILLTGTLGDLFGYGVPPQLAFLEAIRTRRLAAYVHSYVASSRANNKPLLSSVFMMLKGLRPRIKASSGSIDDRGVSRELLARADAARQIARPIATEFSATHRSLVRQLYEIADRNLLAVEEDRRPLWLTHPYSHRPLIEFLLAAPRLALFDPMVPRAGMKRALADVLPRAILDRQNKIGIPPTSLRRAQRRFVDAARKVPPLTDAPSKWQLVQRGVVDAHALANHVHAAMRSDSRPSEFLSRCCHIEAWLRSLQCDSVEYAGPLGDDDGGSNVRISGVEESLIPARTLQQPSTERKTEGERCCTSFGTSLERR